MNELELKVAEAMQIDYGKRVVRLDSNARRLLGLTTGDVVEIKGKKATAALVLPAHPQDEGLNIIRMDGILRQNTSVALGDRVKVKKAQIRNAKKIVLAPNQNSRYAPGFDSYVKKNLIGKPLSKGDILSVNVFGTSFPFVVAQTLPAGLLLVAPETELVLREEPVKEMGKIATISYEDIGGLKEEVQKIREMVELPMRHPELFERLGIEPPKGVLLYGPPGTGKTLLARAVANESDAHFITINGPEIVCVAGDTQIVLADGTVDLIQNVFEKAKAEHGSKLDAHIEYVDAVIPVLSMGSAGRIEPAKATRVMKLPAPRSFTVKTRFGRAVTASENEPFAVLQEDGELRWIKAKDLKTGQYVAGARKLRLPALEYAFDVKKLVGLKAHVKGHVKDAAACTRDELEHALFFYPSRNQNRVDPVKLPLKNSAEFMEFAGFMFSEGSISARGDEVAFANLDATLKNRFAALAASLFGLGDRRIKTYRDKVCIHSKIITDFLVHVAQFYEGKKPSSYHLPKYVKRAPEEWVARFLGAYLDGDGGVAMANGYPTPHFYSASLPLLQDIQFMLLRLGVRSKALELNGAYGRMHKLSVQGSLDRQTFARLISVRSETKAKNLAAIHHQVKQGDDVRLPVRNLLHRLKNGLRMRYDTHLPEKEFERCVSGRDPVTVRKVQSLLPHFEKRLETLKEAQTLLKKAEERMRPVQRQGEPFASLTATPALLESVRQDLAQAWRILDVKESDVAPEVYHKTKYYLKYGATARSAAPVFDLLGYANAFFEDGQLQRAEKDLTRLNELVSGDVFFDEVAEIKQEGAMDVYDLTVEGTSNFIGNQLVLHNSKFVGEAEERLRQIFNEAEENAPSIIFIDELDSVAPKREEVVGEVEKRIVSQMLCVAPETPIYTPEGVIPIQKLYESTEGNRFTKDDVEYVMPKNLEVTAMDGRGQIRPSRVLALNKLFVPDAFRIRLANGADLKTSAIQRFCTIRDGKIDWVPIDELAAGDYVATPVQVPFSEKPFNVFEHVPDSYSVKVSDSARAVFGRAYVNLDEFRHFQRCGVLKDDGTLRTAVLNFVREKGTCTLDSVFERFAKKKTDQIALRRILVALEALGSLTIQRVGRRYQAIRAMDVPVPTEADVAGVSVFHYFQRYVKDAYYVKPVAALSPELSALLGYVMAVGSLAKNRLNVSGKPEVIRHAQDLVLSLFGKPGKITEINERCHRLDVACQSIPALLHDVFGIPIGKKSHILRLPPALFTANSEVKKAFIQAYVDCDASVQNNIRVFSRSRKMMEDLSALFFSLGYSTSYAFANGMHYCNVLGGTSTILRYASEIGSRREDRLAQFQRLLTSRKVSSSIRFVSNVQEAVNALLDGMQGLADNDYRYLSGAKSMDKDKLSYLLGLYGKQKTKTVLNLEQLLSAQVSWTRIESIARIPGMTMYDLTTETENFVGGNVPTMLHNTLMDGLKGRGQVVVIGATNRENAIDPALRRPGRFDREIEIGVPDKKSRKEILQIHTRGMPLSKDVSLDEIAAQTHGFVGADMHSLTKEAAMKALRRVLPKINLEDEEIPAQILEELKVTRDDMKNALREIQPSALREVFVEAPNVRWSDVGGLDEAKREIREAVEMPLKKPEAFKRLGIRPVKGILLYGPPGTGKTMLAKAVATEAEANFISIKGPEVLSKWVGDSEKAVREIFRKARLAAPTIIFIDELDSIAPVRGGDEDSGHVSSRVVDTLLTEMDGLKNIKEILVIGATNRMDIIDPALLRPGRFDKIIEIGLPDEATRLAVFKVHTEAMPLNKVDIRHLAKVTNGFSGADIEGLCREAAMVALRENVNAKVVEPKHFEKALSMLSPILMKRRQREKDLQYA